MPLDSNWLTPTNVGQTYDAGDSTPQWPNEYMHWGLGSAGSGLYDEAAKYGYAGAMPVFDYGEGNQAQVGNPQEDLMNWMKTSGYQYGVRPGYGGSQSNAWFNPQGQQIPGSQRYFDAPDDNAFFTLASMALSPFGGLGAGGAAGGLGGTLASGSSAAAINGAASGAFGALGSGGDLKDVARSTAAGYLSGGYTPDAGGAMGLSGTTRDVANGMFRGGANAVLGGGDVKQGTAMGGLYAGLNSLGSSGMDENAFGQNYSRAPWAQPSEAILDNQSYAPWSGGNTGYVPQQEQQEQNPWGSQSLGDFASSIMGKLGGGKGLGDLASGLMGMYSGYRRRNAASDMMRNVGGNRDAYLANMRNTLTARDAARGRRSNIGGREVELMAKLAELDSRNAPMMAQLSDQRFGGLEQMMASGLRYGNKQGWFGNSGGAPTGQGYSGPGMSMSGYTPPQQDMGSSYSLYDQYRRNRSGGQ